MKSNILFLLTPTAASDSSARGNSWPSECCRSTARALPLLYSVSSEIAGHPVNNSKPSFLCNLCQFVVRLWSNHLLLAIRSQATTKIMDLLLGQKNIHKSLMKAIQDDIESDRQALEAIGVLRTAPLMPAPTNAMDET